MKDLGEAMRELRAEIEQVRLKLRSGEHMFRTHISGNVPADAAERLSDQPTVNDEFDLWDDNLFHDICGESLSLPIQDLLIALDLLEKTEGSFGADAQKTVEYLVPKLYRLKEAVLNEWRAL